MKINCEFIAINQSYELPMMMNPNISGITHIMMYLHAQYPNILLNEWYKNHEIQCMETFFHTYMYHNVYKLSINEYLQTNEQKNINIKCDNQQEYLSKLNTILKNQNFIHNNTLSLNDLSCFAYLITLHLFNQIRWFDFLSLKTWFMRMNSNDNFNFITKDLNHNLLLDF
jgi:glutathione S-transferase